MPKTLVEECLFWRFATMRHRLGRVALLDAYLRGQPITVPGLAMPIELAADTVYLPWKGTMYNARAYTERLGFACPRCGRRTLVLYGIPDAFMLRALGCRRCLKLVYYSQNCGGNRWYERVVKPRRRLRRLEARLSRRLHRDARARLERERAVLQQLIAYGERQLQPIRRRPRRLRSRQQVLRGARMPEMSPRRRPSRSLNIV